MFFGGDDSSKHDQAKAARSVPGSTSTAQHSDSARVPPATITASPGSGGPPGPGGGEPTGSGSSSGNNGNNGGNSNGSNGSSGSPGNTSAPGGNRPICADSALTLSVQTDQTDYRVGEQPVIGLTLTNTSRTACRRDVGSAEQEAVVSSAGNHVWSSNDCDPGGDPDVRVIDPGKSLHFSVTWGGTTSKPECPGPSARAGAGSYNIVARVGSLHSDPAKFTLSQP